jgi:hypothetical protein
MTVDDNILTSHCSFMNSSFCWNEILEDRCNENNIWLILLLFSWFKSNFVTCWIWFLFIHQMFYSLSITYYTIRPSFLHRHSSIELNSNQTNSWPIIIAPWPHFFSFFSCVSFNFFFAFTSCIPTLLAFLQNEKRKIKKSLSLAFSHSKSSVCILRVKYVNESLSICFSLHICFSIRQNEKFFFVLLVFSLKTAVSKRLIRQSFNVNHTDVYYIWVNCKIIAPINSYM